LDPKKAERKNIISNQIENRLSLLSCYLSEKRLLRENPQKSPGAKKSKRFERDRTYSEEQKSEGT